MNTLYDFLGVRSDADDETLRKAFRKAIKATHPDLHAGDPDAPLRFRQIVDANALLRDAKQRATYDWLLQLEHQRFRLKLEYQQRHLKLERQQLRLKRMRIIVSGAIAVTVLTFALVDGYALFVPIPTRAIVTVKPDGLRLYSRLPPFPRSPGGSAPPGSILPNNSLAPSISVISANRLPLLPG